MFMSPKGNKQRLFFGIARHDFRSDTSGTYWLEDEKFKKVEPEVRKLPVSEVQEVALISV